MRHINKSAGNFLRMAEQLKTKGSFYIGTRNKYWFMARFKDVTGLDVELRPVDKSDTLYTVKIKKS